MTNTFRKQAKRFTAAAGSLLVMLAAMSFGQLLASPPSGAELFKTKCAVCHGADGSGNTPMGQHMKVSDLRSPEVQKQTDAEIDAFITKGKPPMPAYGKSLTPAAIHELVAFVRSLASKP